MMSEHICKAGVVKLEIKANGDIIPCAAFKGLSERFPTFVLGNIKDTTLEEALKRGQKIPFLRAYRRWRAWQMKWLQHQEGCETCQELYSICDEGKRLAWKTLEIRGLYLRRSKEYKEQ